MDSHMHCSSWFLSEFSIANFTSKRLFTSMNSFVTFQNWWAPKWFLTNITIIFASEIIGRLTFSSRHFRNVFNDQYFYFHRFIISIFIAIFHENDSPREDTVCGGNFLDIKSLSTTRWVKVENETVDCGDFACYSILQVYRHFIYFREQTKLHLF